MLAITPDRATIHPLAVPSLGNVAKYAATRTTPSKTTERVFSRQDRFSLQEGARRLVPHERVARCCRYLRKGETHVELLHSAGEGRAHYGALEVCSSVWLCPVCAAKIAEQRRRELAEAIAACRAAGGAVLHLTFTVRHGHGDELAGLVERFGRAYRRLTGHRAYRHELRPKYQAFGSVRALEVTHGAHGWHPHYHVLLFVSRPLTPAQVDELAGELRALWSHAAALDGLAMNEHGLSITASGGAVADYVAKFGRDPQSEPWGPESELTRLHLKRAKAGGATPWDLLRRFLDGDGRAGHLWREYAGTFKGRQQLVWSPNLRAALGLFDELPDDQAAGRLPDDAAHLCWVSFADWLIVLRYGRRGELLQVAGAGDRQLVIDYLAELRSLRQAERRRRGLDPPLPAPPARQLALWSA